MIRVFIRGKKDGGTWWYDLGDRDGKRIQRSLGAPARSLTKSQARDLALGILGKMAHEKIHGKAPEAVSFASFADEWLRKDSPMKKSKSRDREIVEMLKIAWKGQSLGSITTEMIEDYKAMRLGTPEKPNRAPATVNKEIQVIKRLFKKAHAWGRIPTNPAITVEKEPANNARVRYLEAEEMTRLMKWLPGWLRPIVIFARVTGARRGEILELTWNDVDYKRELITFRDTKNGETGHVEMNTTARAVLESLPRPLNRGLPVFPPVKIEKLRKAWLTACRRARIGEECGCMARTADQKPKKGCHLCAGTGIDVDFRFHDLRHQAATDLLTLGAGLNDVRDFLRHKTTAMTLRYAHLVKDRRTRTARLLDSLSIPVDDAKVVTSKTADPVTPASPSSSLA